MTQIIHSTECSIRTSTHPAPSMIRAVIGWIRVADRQDRAAHTVAERAYYRI